MADQHHVAESEKATTGGNDNHARGHEKLRSDSEDTRVAQSGVLKSQSDDIERTPEEPLESQELTSVRWTFSRIIAFASLCIVYTGSQIILYFTAGALVYMQASIGTKYPNWLLTANTLAAAATLPFVGYITDLLGRRWVCILGTLLCVISAAVIGTSHTLASNLVGQTLGGVGTGITELTALAGVAEITPVRWRGVCLAIVNLSLLPFMPYLIYITEAQEASTWRWVFLIVGGWNVAGLLGIFFCYHPPPRRNVEGKSRLDIVKQIDYIGFVLSFGGITLFLVGLQAGGYQFPWTDVKVLAPLLIGVVMVLLFPLWEAKGSKNPLVPMDIFRGQRVVGLSFVLAFIGGMTFFALLGFYPIMLQKLFISQPITIGVRSLGLPLGVLVGGMITNILLSYTKGHVKALFFVAATVMTAFLGALVVATPTNPKVTVAIATCAALGVGAFLIPSLALALYACPDRYIGTTSALALTIRFLGGAVGTAIFYNIFNTKSLTLTPQYVAQAVVPLGYPAEGIPALIEAFMAPDFQTASQMALQAVSKVVPDPAKAMSIVMAAGQSGTLALAKSLTYVWYTTIAFGALAMIGSLFLPNIRTYMTNRVAVEIR